MVEKYANVPSRGNGPKRPKIFVLDTNIVLHDYKAIRKFQDNDIVIPIAVLEELDKFKKGTDALSFNARGFMRTLTGLPKGRCSASRVSRSERDWGISRLNLTILSLTV